MDEEWREREEDRRTMTDDRRGTNGDESCMKDDMR